MNTWKIVVSLLALSPGALSQDPWGDALDFDGTDDIVTVPYSDSLGVEGAFTLETWVLPDTTEEGGIAGMWGHGGLPDKFLLYIENGQLVGQILRIGALEYDAVSYAIDHRDWTHVALVYDGVQLELRINGVLRDSAEAPGQLYSLPMSFRMGIKDITWGELHHLNGRLDEMRLWNIARTAEEIERDARTTFSGGQPGLVGQWSFNGGRDPQAVRDSSGHGNDGTLGALASEEPSDPARTASSVPLGWRAVQLEWDEAVSPPVLRGRGTREAGAPSLLSLTGAPPQSIAALVVGLSRSEQPFLGSTMFPSMDVLVLGIPTDANGAIAIALNWPDTLSKKTAYFQAWTLDPIAPQGFCASNGLSSHPRVE